MTTECLQCNAFQTVSVLKTTRSRLDNSMFNVTTVCVSEDVVSVRSDGIRGASQLHQIQQGRAQEVRTRTRPLNPAVSSLLVSEAVLTPPSFSVSCRSTVMEEHLFWKFEAAMLALTALFGVLVVVRQRWLDRLASEKVRRQIESI